MDNSKNKHCDFNSFKRARYFHGMLMSERDFEDEQKYHIEKRKLLNKMLHGWGVVCGLGLGIEKCKSSTLVIDKGMALDCNGNEILVNTPYELDVEAAIQSSITAGEPLTAEKKCEKGDLPQTGPDRWYVVVKYREVPITPVPVYAPGGGCEEKVCEHSRIREGFCVELHKEIPYQPFSRITSLAEMVSGCASGKGNTQDEIQTAYEDCLNDVFDEFISGAENAGDGFCASVPPCPECCPCEHYLILGTVSIENTGANKNYTVNSNEARQYVFSPHLFKYLFRVLLEGSEKILTDMVPELCLLGVPDVNLLHQNPIAALCWLGKLLLAQLDNSKDDYNEEAAKIKGWNDEAIYEFFQKQDFNYIGNVALSKENRKELFKLSYSIKNLQAGDGVEVVIGDNNTPIFYIPAREIIEIRAFKQEYKKNLEVIDKLKSEIEMLKAVKKKTK
ncbi:MAG: hypothetical protein GY765_10090 [bacterium]|nr:hypothetical protein [bacterium]